MRDALHIPAYIHEDDAELLTDEKKNAFSTFFGKSRVWRSAEYKLHDGDTISIGDEKITVIHTPGHTQGSVCYLCDDTLITGDTLFADNVGRTDLYGGSLELLSASLDLLRSLDGSMRIAPGHGADGILRDALDNSAYYF
jgi:glyoxylase-like metal-dependent hydrolase (beta-lactamase superfamily II)